ncbi:hypothetical protein QQ045_031613 [Rhodiola kirilowii]
MTITKAYGLKTNLVTIVHSGTEEGGSSSSRKTRGSSYMNKLIKKHKDGTKESVTIEPDGTIVGEVGTSCRSYISNGIVAKSRVTITYDNWKVIIPKELRDLVWDETM